jgi:hypothetical protein
MHKFLIYLSTSALSSNALPRGCPTKTLCRRYVSHFPASASHPGHVSRLDTARFEGFTGTLQEMLVGYDTMSSGVAFLYVLKDHSVYTYRVKHSIAILEGRTTLRNVGNFLPVDMA